MSRTPQEKKALIAISAVLIFIIGALIEIGSRNDWFESKRNYYGYVSDASGLNNGTDVTLSGLRIGQITELTVENDFRVKIVLSLNESIADKITSAAVAEIVKPVFIGEAKIILKPGTVSGPPLADGDRIAIESGNDWIKFLNDGKWTELAERAQVTASKLEVSLSEALTYFEDQKMKNVTSSITLVQPALANFVTLSRDLLKITHELVPTRKKMPVIVERGADVLNSVDQVIQPIAEKRALIVKLLTNLEDLSADLSQHPDYGKKVIHTLDELVLTLKAVQKTWLLRDHAEAVTEEQKKKSPEVLGH